jgi:hypothetical protein
MRAYVLVFMLASVAACGALVDVGVPSEGGPVADSGKPTDSGTLKTTSLPTCTWPASLDPQNGSTSKCVATRAYLSCQGTNGGNETVLATIQPNALAQMPRSA